MQHLTSQLLNNYPIARYATPQSIQHGRAYYKDGRVWEVDLISSQKASCLVNGDTGEYTVEIEINKKSGDLSFECDCYYAEEGNFCKHIVAAMMEVSEYLKGEEVFEEEEEEEFDTPDPRIKEVSGDWKNKLMQTVALMPRQSTGGRRINRYAVAVVLTRSSYGFYAHDGGQSYSYTLEPFIIKESDWSPLQEVEDFDPLRVRRLLETTFNWLKVADQFFSHADPAGCLNLSQDAVAFINIFRNTTRMYAGQMGSNLANYLPMLALLDIPIFLGSAGQNARIERRLHILPAPVQIQIDMQRDERKLSLQAGFEQGKDFTHIRKKIEVMTSNPVWVLMDDTIARVENSRALVILSAFPMEIPDQQVELFREQYFPLIAQALPVKSDLVQWRDIHADAIPRLYLHDDNKDKTLRASLRFGYGDFTSLPGKDQQYSVASIPDTWELVRIHRQPEREEYFYQLLTDPVYRLKRAGAPHPQGTFELRARAHLTIFFCTPFPC